MRTERRDLDDGAYLLQALDDNGEPMTTPAGEPIIADSRRCRNPETWLWQLVCKAGRGSMSYSERGRV